MLIVSGIAKLRHPEDESAWAELGVAAVLRQRWLMKLHPWAEIALALALLLLGGPLGALAAAVGVALFGVYLALVWRRRVQAPGASCNCFGSRRPITAFTVARNAWFLLLALVTAGVTWATPLLGGPLLALGGEWVWALALGAVAVTVFLIVSEPASADAVATAGVPIVGAGDSAQDGEYVRVRTPAVPVQYADGRTVNLRTLAAHGPMLLLAVKEDCLSCTPVIEAVPRWRALLPEVAVRLLLWPVPENSTLTEHTEPQSLHDPYMYVRGSIADWSTPAAVLIGADGYLAGGPVSGADEVSSFIADIYESLHGERPHAG